MATYTTRLNLRKPDPSDFYNIADFNDNADKIDAKMLRIDDDKASQVEAETGTDDTKWMSPLRVRQGINKLKANQSEAQTGTDDTKWMSPLRVRNSFNAMKASQSEAYAGTIDTKWMSPLRVKDSIARNTFKVGDTIETYRTDLGANWALCNGDFFKQSEYPSLASIMPEFPATYPLRKPKKLPAVPQTYKEVNGYQVITARFGSKGMMLYYSQDNFETYNEKVIYPYEYDMDSYDRWLKSNIFYVNGYWIYVWSGGQSTPGSLNVYYSTSLGGTWTKGASGSDDFYGSEAGFGAFYDLIYKNGTYYLIGACNKDTDVGTKYIVQVTCTSPSFKKSAGAQSIRGSTIVYASGFVNTGSKLVYIGYADSKYYTLYADINTPTAYTQKNFTVSGTSPETKYFESLTYIDGKYMFVGYVYGSPSSYYPVICQTSDIIGSTWTGTKINLPFDRSDYMPRGPILKCRNTFILPGPSMQGNYYSGIFFGKSISSLQFMETETSGGSTTVINTLGLTNDDESVSMFWSDASRIDIPAYAVPNVDASPLYKYIKVKDGV